ncbi:NADH-quinone oxidoreductase subunit J [Bailinhaonella thermotolerans]|uniref:NADH-quinone oxidoreductase subunit J n=1 Tax=Bailinhaonella thermotolerans TaxID=1070861 RepID=A0A3A4AAQ5_9ACTN|nr:NADH-quinone oxidoreductase subunit J [Bailinhaonella thermotolerans]RJL22498.1 NADH-quinone oxidoreductase subunit J [Bailinhaonella thermotolerans]
MGEQITFWVLAVVSVAAALGLVFNRKAVYSAIMLAVVMLSLAALYAVQDAPFLAVVQIIVYTGAVLMLFLFVLMLVGVDSSDSLVETIRGQRFLAAVVGLGFAVLLILGIGNVLVVGEPSLTAATQEAGGNVPALARLIFQRHVFAFEVTSALLITAALGAMVLAHRERTTPRPTQKDLARARFLGPQPTPLPGPGTYARHNAVDMPALLPDGSVSLLSVNPTLARHEVEGDTPATTPEAREAAVLLVAAEDREEPAAEAGEETRTAGEAEARAEADAEAPAAAARPEEETK